MRILLSCGMLAAGEFAASFSPAFADVWPALALAATLVALLGYGLSVRGWWLVSLFLLGGALFLRASSEEEQRFREQPWMRGRDRQVRQERRWDSDFCVMLRRNFSHRISVGLERDREMAELSRAILLGERSRLPARTRRLFVESGTMHVFAISGLHVMAVADVLTGVLRLFWLPRQLSGYLALPLLWGYVLLIGAPPSAVRAAMMATFGNLAFVFWRRPNGLRAWALTFLLVHVWNPLLIVNVGNALSFAVMLAIIWAGEVSSGWTRGKQAVLTTVSAWAVGVPISAAVFGRVTPGGLLANLVLVATAKAAVYAGAVGLVSSYASETLACHLNNLCALAIRTMVMIAEAVTCVPGTNFETGKWTLVPCLAWYAGCAVVLLLLSKAARKRRLL